MLSEVGGPTHYGWHHSLAVILNCVNGERELSHDPEFLSLCFRVLMGWNQVLEVPVALTSLPCFTEPLNCGPQ